MKCEQANQLMNAFVDNEINQQELKKLNEHLDSCESCTVEFEEIKYMVQLMGEIDLKELPLGFEEELHEKLILAAQQISPSKEKVTEEINKSNVFTRFMDNLSHFKMKRSYYAFAAIPAVIVIVAIASKGFLNQNKSEEAMAYDSNSMQETTAAAMFGSEDDSMRAGGINEGAPEVVFSENALAKGTVTTNASPESMPVEPVEQDTETEYREGRMIIQSANLAMDVEKYDDVMKALKAMVEASGGYVENESTSFKSYTSETDNLKYGYITIRIPATGYSATLEQIKTLGLVTMDSSNASDITKAYRDTAAEIENLKVTETRLREIMAQAVEITDILAIENELTRIRGSISAYEKQIKDWESLVDLTTITIELNEVKNLKPVVEPIDDSLFGKAFEGFINSINGIKRAFEGLIIWIIANSPFLVSLAIIAVVARRLYKKRRQKNEK